MLHGAWCGKVRVQYCMVHGVVRLECNGAWCGKVRVQCCMVYGMVRIKIA